MGDERAVARFWSKVDKTAFCWVWQASKNRGGYGQASFGGRTQRAHRVAYMLAVGPIPEGLQLDHLCRNRACVNPAHLEPVTPRENCIRGIGPQMARERFDVTHCKLGHPLSGDNLRTTRRGGRVCRTCKRQHAREYLGFGPPVRARGPVRLVVERITTRKLRLDCGHVVERANGHRHATARCSVCELVMAS